MKDRLANEFLYLSEADVAGLGVSMEEMIAALEAMFREKAAGRVEMPPKPGIHTMPNAFLHAMPAYIPAQKAAGMKWVGGYPENQARGLPYISGLLVLNDVETGFPLALMDATWITAQRTGAATAIAAKHLARDNARTLGILGCGVQGRSNLEALNAVLELVTVHAYDVDEGRNMAFVREMSEQFEVDVFPVAQPRDAVSGCDVIVTAGPILRVPHATIQKGWMDEGAFASLVDFDSYWHADALREADRFCTDDVAQLEHYREMGYFQNIPPVYADLGELVTGRKPGRESATERTIACNLGLALEDIVTAALVYERAVERRAGVWLPL